MNGLTLLIDPAGHECRVSDHAVADRLKNGWSLPKPKKSGKNTKSTPKEADENTNQ